MTRLLFVPDPHTLLWLDFDLPPKQLIEQVLRGEWLPPAPFDQMKNPLNAYWQEGLVIISSLTLHTAPVPTANPRLSRRQIEILRCLQDGLTTRQMALRMGLAQRTVFHHIACLKKVYRVSSRAELLRRARSKS
jgi:two-component system, NarL family, nitrate/nitrite response regulator NarL